MKLNMKLLIAASLSAIALLASVKLKATPSIPTGSCSALISVKSAFEIGLLNNNTGNYSTDPGSQNITGTGISDALILINFIESKIYVNATKTDNIYEYSLSGSMIHRITHRTETLNPIALLISDGPLPGSYLLTAPANTIPDLILMPVNSGNTYLIQAKDSKATGVCQKI